MKKILFIFILILFGRLKTSLLFPSYLDPDEMQMGANSLRLIGTKIDMGAFDGTSSGVLNSLILCWPNLLNLDVTYISIKITSLLLIIFITILTYKIIKIISNKTIATIFIIPLIIFYAFTKDPHYLHYSSELLSVTILLLSLYLLFYQIKKQKDINQCSNKITFLTLFLLGSIPYAKIQFVLPAIAIALIYFIFIYKKKILRKHFIMFFIGGILTSVIFLLPLYQTNNLENFFISNFQWSIDYIVTNTTTEVKNITSSETLQGRPINKYFYHLKNNSGLHLLYFYSFFILFGSLLIMKKEIFNKYNYLIILLILITILVSIILPARLHRHYLHSLFPFMSIFASIVINISYNFLDKNFRVFFIRFFGIFFIIGLIIFSALLYKEEKNSYVKTQSYFNSFSFNKFNNPNLFQYLKVDNLSGLYVYGWMPHLYILSNLMPAASETHTYNQIVNSKSRPYYRKRAMRDIIKADPDLIIDTVNGKSFVLSNPKMNISNFPELQSFITKNYLKINKSSLNINCAHNYLKRDKYNLLKKYLIEFSSIKSSSSYNDEFKSSNVNDFSVTEDTCVDYWMLPDHQLGNIVIKFKKEELVKRILILNTQNSNLFDRSTNEIEVNLFNMNSIIKSYKIKVNPYPYWTEVILKKPINSEYIKINILSYKGKGAGLNEIKVFKN